jgi:ABC-2 type transport system ATP-binding protein
MALIELDEVSKTFTVRTRAGRVRRHRRQVVAVDRIATPVRQLSLGQRMRGELVTALLHEPPVVLLDEPTIGLDLVSKEAVRSFLVELNRETGTTVLLTTHAWQMSNGCAVSY